MIGNLGLSTRTAFGAASFLVLVVSLALGADASAEPAASEGRAEYASDHVLVKLEPGISTLSALDDAGEVVDGGWRRVAVPDGMTPVEMVSELRTRDDVVEAEVDHVIQLDPVSTPVPLGQVAPVSVDDPHHGLQWHFPPIQLDQAWAEGTGNGVVVAVLDTGISQGGEDLACHTFVAPYNAITGATGPAAASDDHGHGTHVAGTVAQCTSNGVGVAGVAFDASLMPVKVLNSAGNGLVSHLAEGIHWARTHGADVINLSLGCFGCQHSIVDDALEAAAAAGIVIVAASGNSGASSVAYPASHPDVIAVGATDYRNVRAPYSNRGSLLDLVAPGGDLNRDDNGDGHPDGVLQETFCDQASCLPSVAGSNGWGYYFSSGTSMAAPHVSGAAALLLSAYPDASPEAVRNALTTTAGDLGPTGFDSSYGHGLLQIHDALQADLVPPSWSQDATLRVDRYGETSLTLSWSGASDNVGVTGYVLRRQDSEGVTVSGTQATVTGLTPESQHVFEVLARDGAGNWSEPLAATVRTAQRFADTQGHTFYIDILWMSGTGVTRGCNPPVNDEYCPNDIVTRGQVAAFIARVLGLTANTHPGFVDVPAGSTFAADIGKLATAGLTRGCNPPANDRFCPDDPVTRAQIAAFIVRAIGLGADTHPGFADVPPSHTFRTDIGRQATAGITRGCNPPTNDMFCPDDQVTRGELAAFFHRGWR